MNAMRLELAESKTAGSRLEVIILGVIENSAQKGERLKQRLFKELKSKAKVIGQTKKHSREFKSSSMKIVKVCLEESFSNRILVAWGKGHKK